MSKSKKEVTKSDQVPDFLKTNKNRGSEEVEVDDIIIPRLELAQALSPAQKKSHDNYIDGCEEGDLYNNITRELYGPEVLIIPVYYKKEWLLWRDRKADTGGFHGAYESPNMAEQARELLERPENVEAVETHQHFCLLVNDESRAVVEEIVVSMARSKMKVSRAWNALVRINGGDRFSRIYKCKTVDDANQKGDEYKNLKIINHSFVTEELFKRAEKLYDSIRSGRVTVDRTMEEYDEGDDSSSKGSEDF